MSDAPPNSSAAVSSTLRTKLDDVIVAAGSLLLIGSFFWVPIGVVTFYKKYCKTKRRKLAFFAAIALLVFLPVPVKRSISRHWFWSVCHRYFGVRFFRSCDYPKQALYCVIPHGIFPIGVAFASVGEQNASAFGDSRPIVASSIFHAPVIGHLLKLLGAVQASPASVRTALESGLSLILSPGGIREIFWGYPRPGCEPNCEYALLLTRFGFIRRAIETGVAVVPVYVFGTTKTFKRIQLPLWIETLSQWLKTSIVLFWGRWGLPVPFRVPLWFVIGEPIPVPCTSHPTDEQVREVHKRFCNALVELFEKYKGQYGWSHKSLVLV